jgi:hypothetical protein
MIMGIQMTQPLELNDSIAEATKITGTRYFNTLTGIITIVHKFKNNLLVLPLK